MLYSLAPLALLLTGVSAVTKTSTITQATSTAASTASTESPCADVHMFLARGNGEDYPGRVGAMGPAVCDGLDSCDFENIMFVSNEVYCNAVSDGAAAGVAQMTAYANRCPNSKLVLAGYSLGGQIMGDILGGYGVQEYTCTEKTGPALDPNSSPGNRLAAIAIFGDVRHTGGQSYNVGTGAAFDGQYPRSGQQLTAMNNYSNKIRSWCLSQDPICALGNDGLSHETYMTVFAADAGAWIQDMVLNIPDTSDSSSSSTPSSTTTSSSSTSSSSSNSKSASGSSSSSSSSSSSTSSSSSSSTTSTSVASTRRSLSTSFSPFVFASTSFSSYTHSLTTTRTSFPSSATPTSSNTDNLSTPLSVQSTSVLSTSSSHAAGTRPTPFVAQVFRMIARR